MPRPRPCGRTSRRARRRGTARRRAREHGLAAAWEEVFAPALHAVGRKRASSASVTSRSSTCCPGRSRRPSAAYERSAGRRASPPYCSPAYRASSTPSPWRRSRPLWGGGACPRECSAPPFRPRPSARRYAGSARRWWCCGHSPVRPPTARRSSSSRGWNGVCEAPGPVRLCCSPAPDGRRHRMCRAPGGCTACVPGPGSSSRCSWGDTRTRTAERLFAFRVRHTFSRVSLESRIARV